MVGAFRSRIFATQYVDYLWVFDYDISWAGDLAQFIEAFANDDADLLVAKDDGRAMDRARAKGQHPDRAYVQFPIRNYLDDEEVFSALLAPVRYSRRMLAATRGLIASGKAAFCETRGPSLCHQEASWCRQRSMTSLRPELFNKNFSCCKSHSERYSRERSGPMWDAIPKHKRPPVQLLHRVKLDKHNAQASGVRKERHIASLATNRTRGR